jgi:hypothetical protein
VCGVREGSLERYVPKGEFMADDNYTNKFFPKWPENLKKCFTTD